MSKKKAAKKTKKVAKKKVAKKTKKIAKKKIAKKKAVRKVTKAKRRPKPRALARPTPSPARTRAGPRALARPTPSPARTRAGPRASLVPPEAPGLLVVLSGPSGAGKSTLARALAVADGRLWRSVSLTTRQPRADERNGVDYLFVSREEFLSARSSGALLESATVHGEFYGTPLGPAVVRLLQDRDVLLEIDVQGGTQVKAAAPEAVLVFVRTPSRAVLEQRLRGRGSESEPALTARLATADSEMRRAKDYDYIVVNDDIERATSDILSVIAAERSRTQRGPDLPW